MALVGYDRLMASLRLALAALAGLWLGVACHVYTGQYSYRTLSPSVRTAICKLLEPWGLRARVHVYSLALIFVLWGKPHYRNGTFQEDMIKNLRNVAIPGTGIPLSTFCYSRITAAALVLFLNPLVCLLGAVNKVRLELGPFLSLGQAAQRFASSPLLLTARVLEVFCEHLLQPDDWFSFWRLNCRLASLHALRTNASGYRCEDKWTFLVEGEAKGIPVSPYLRTPATIVAKDVNEEGGLGIFFFTNAAAGGRFILQERLDNSPELSALLPANAPLSTVRVITASEGGLGGGGGGQGGAGAAEGATVRALSCVFRAGRSGAATDHSSVLFDVAHDTGAITRGMTNAHWYRLYHSAWGCPWLPQGESEMREHPDKPGEEVVGRQLPDVGPMLRMVEQSHAKLLPDVPLVGWDVAYTDKGMVLLEVNLSCNFFRGSFDRVAYFNFVDRYFRFLDTPDAAPAAAAESEHAHEE